MKIIITGSAGFIGYHLSKTLIERGDTVIGIDQINDYYDTELKHSRLKNLGIEKNKIEFGKKIISTAYINHYFYKGDIENYDFIDFECIGDLYQYLERMNEETYNVYLNNINSYLTSKKAELFDARYNAELIVNQIVI
jgi:NAD(P)-dependent dehydrogenase (short-subunit alcohol dehydrogenase family)